MPVAIKRLPWPAIEKPVARMPEIRKDPISGRSVIIAEDRALRPNDFAAEPSAVVAGDCPFCPGHESSTPHEIDALREDGLPTDDPNWRVRVIPNKYPALAAEGLATDAHEGLYESIAGVGAHEVIVESPRHIHSTSQLTDQELAEVLEVYRRRMRAIQSDERLAHGLIFKNVGPAAGASLEHLHSQLIALPMVPIFLRDELTGSQAFYIAEQRCIFCEMIAQEATEQQRTVMETPQFTAFCPFASRFPFETWILPKTHASHFETISDTQTPELAHILRHVIKKIEISLRQSAYNYIIHSAPFDTCPQEHYHWHIEIIPRLTMLAGFELGSGLNINPMPPEVAAQRMRESD